MYMYSLAVLGMLVAGGFSAAHSSYNNSGSFNLRPFTLNLTSEVPHMLDLVNNTRLPDASEYPGASAGIPLDSLKSLRAEWLTQFDWDKEQLAMNT